MFSEKYIRVIKDVYKGATTQVRSVVGTTEKFEVQVGLHQCSTLSPYIFDLVMDVMVADIKDQVPWSVLFADDVAVGGDNQRGGREETRNGGGGR